MKALRYISPIVAGMALLAGACSSQHGWSVDGTVADAPEGTRLVLEANNAGLWYAIDTLDVAANGKFAYKAAEPMHNMDIMRLTLPGKGSVYFPVDSVDAITVNAPAATFGTGHTLAGTPVAEKFASIDSIVANITDTQALQYALVNTITADTTGIVAYYAVGKAVGGKPVFDPATSAGNRVYGAAAQIYTMHHPDDPRALALRRTYFLGRQLLGKMPAPEETVLEVPSTGIMDITRYDSRGNEHSLSEVAGDGVALLSFTAYGLPSSPAYNAILHDLYEKYSDRGLKIYQVSFDDDEVAWKEAARNIPWVAVWNAPSDGVNVLTQYNVGALPQTFLIRNGEISKRILDPNELDSAVKASF
ncbi:MAG: redoxin domain-containing protein [Muribaculaceae bacterium]|nr:redoxin domain-containing protein [Muribaculaceae bacterium]